ncbi:MAG: NAD(P)/FAD-dependent oxidoreductase [Planctomycetota bacterium]|jgi:flavin-dependent dehydrogenase
MEILHLRDNSRIAIIGAGPAGTLFAYLALRKAKACGMNVSITIFDGKDFTLTGPLGCNMCAGILSETLLEKLSQDGIIVPDEVVQKRISGYYVQTENDRLLLQNPRGKRITTVFRGNGPRFYNPNGTISFDDFLLTVAQENGAKVVAQPVIDVILPKTKSDAVQLIYGEGNEFEADLVVGAFGVNTAFAEKIRALNFGYQPPKVLRGMQTELLLGKEHIQQDFGDNVIIFRLGLKGIRFAAFTPKSDHITATIVCRTDATRESLSRILLHPAVRRWLPETFQLPRTYCLCHPKIPVTPAKNPFTDRLVIIGDASCSRYFKNGIESAYITAKLAMETAFDLGISASAFRKGYFKQARKLIIRDNFFGRLLFRLGDMIDKINFLSDAHLRLALQNDRNSSARLFRNIHWNICTGNISYRRIFFLTLNPILQVKLLSLSCKVLIERFIKWLSKHIRHR